MHNFFAEEKNRTADGYILTDADYNHIKNVLRMQTGDNFFVSCDGRTDLCALESFEGDCAVVRILEENCQSTELDIKIHLFQGLPKGDKMELIIQKTVELGVYSITPVEMSRCVVKLDDKKKRSKISRWQTISESAAKQSKRNIIPEICDVITYRQALEKMQELDLLLVPYENEKGMLETMNALSEIKKGMNIGIIIGPEGGFDESEITAAKEKGCRCISLGSRILRTETAAVTATGMCMLYSEIRSEVNDETAS